MDIDKIFQDQLIKITQYAAISVYPYLGKNNKIIADEAATNSMRTNLNKMNIKGNIVIGEGEMDEAPMLYIGEAVGTKNGPEFDIAVDPLEGTNFAARNLPGAISVIAISNKNGLLLIYPLLPVNFHSVPRGDYDDDPIENFNKSWENFKKEFKTKNEGKIKEDIDNRKALISIAISFPETSENLATHIIANNTYSRISKQEQGEEDY